MTTTERASVPITDLAALAGTMAWIEGRLFEVLGAWARGTGEPESRLLFAGAGSRHAWRARLWRERLPELREANGDHLVAPDSPTTAELFDRVAALTSAEARLAARFDIVSPAILARCRDVAARTDALVDGPTARVVELVLADEAALAAAGATCRARLGPSSTLDSGEADALAHIEAMVVTAGRIG